MSFLDAAHGVTTSVNLTSDVTCPTCSGSGAAPGTSPQSCPTCKGRGITEENQGFFSFSHPCPTCNGNGTIIEHPCAVCHGSGVTPRQRTVKVRLPEGVRDNQQIRLKGKGAPGGAVGPTATCTCGSTSKCTPCSTERVTTSR
ncbi:MAG: zinc finger domain-containing protein [Microthrixaceae bacterium]